MGILPPRPLPLAENILASRRHKAALLGAFVALVAVGLGAGSWWLGGEAWHERKVWREGETGRVLSLKGKVVAESYVFVEMFYEYDLQVVFADVAGAQHAVNVKFGTTWNRVDDSKPAQLRYLPGDPDHPVLSYSVEAGFARWALPAMLAALGILMVFGAFHMPRANARTEAALREAAQDGEEVLYPLLTVTHYKSVWTVRYEASPGVKATSSGPEEPLIAVRDGQRYVVALRSPRGAKPVLIGAELLVFELGLAERAAIAERLKS